MGLRYPDIVAWLDDRYVVIDTTIIADNFDLDQAHERKWVYFDKSAIRSWCETTFGSADVDFSACVLVRDDIGLICVWACRV